MQRVSLTVILGSDTMRALTPNCWFDDQDDPIHGLISLPDPVMELAGEFEALPDDPYCRHRQRRFSQFRVTHTDAGWTHKLLPRRAHIQDRTYNHAVGGILRYLQPLQIDATAVIDCARRAFRQQRGSDWHVDVHQWRMNCPLANQVESVPEGLHRDGHQFVAIFVINRSNISGAVTCVQDASGNTLFKDVVDSGQGMILDDRRALHHTSELVAPLLDGHRDIFVICANEWKTRRYGEAFELACQMDKSVEPPTSGTLIN
ncbi:MAG TPA: hypothetical protein EYO59_12135, partial [Chromatiaceae bacterium]|nr:hypothetical protein [Chromatiaceae bacterium]